LVSRGLWAGSLGFRSFSAYALYFEVLEFDPQLEQTTFPRCRREGQKNRHLPKKKRSSSPALQQEERQSAPARRFQSEEARLNRSSPDLKQEVQQSAPVRRSKQSLPLPLPPDSVSDGFDDPPAPRPLTNDQEELSSFEEEDRTSSEEVVLGLELYTGSEL
jgi:hypothetical protein